THSEIKDLNYELSQLQDIYQLNYNSDDSETSNDKTNCQNSSENILLDDIDDNYFTLQQLKNFKKLFLMSNKILHNNV
ncbi:14426_t:CDS:1, partial [Gigaspora margarita]